MLDRTFKKIFFILLVCTNGTFGFGCKKVCKCVMESTVDCDRVSGSCSCKAGFMGEICEESKQRKGQTNTSNQTDGPLIRQTDQWLDRQTNGQPDRPLYGQIDRPLNGMTNTRSMRLTADCKMGGQIDGQTIKYTGTRQTKPSLNFNFTFLECQDGYYGDSCQEECACPEDIKCDHLTGNCLYNCPAGLTERNCTQCKLDIR